ncbi:phosphatase PAP2 family protein [Pediococcus claussenii]|uniref:PAP2 superfamily protein n=1 Tax=Pediococcus claussenii (strain ATCC BAA-344 / DSM 14800 / JCM 18046 / KCTC 3811 / LMG 21948 / P06) TaxID=701521 RepID=G8PDW2_PEDCP|nr:phosphatase PAP2 family protein [Pediococcus claussenii]AEV95447.1 PAP2 superfamily protein [Pediococcus claussenii ATCC BAA-344]ANZ68973.1 hypothetical protein AYR57_00945 [Pediococcus claussenii]ANZ70789.1 hypothetical protein AYR58_00945 [Pediococcus claussenii]KRN19089.1 hypothetical protein IV79_GL001751 [Pediococcus claussenii]
MRTTKTSQFAPFILSLVFFILLTLTVKFVPTTLYPFDKFITNLIQLDPSPLKLTFFKIITQIGNQIPFIIINFAILLILTVSKHFKYGIFLLFTTFGSSLINHLIKEWVKRPRPLPHLVRATGYSFPSGHSVVAIALFGGLIIITNQIIKNKAIKFVLNFIWSLGLILLPISRVYLNVHYPSDIIGGMLLGFMILQISRYILIKEF